jgi:hypothetical protein
MYLDDEVDGVVTDIVVLLISLIIGALLDRFKLTIGQSSSMIDGTGRGVFKCSTTSSSRSIHVEETHRRSRNTYNILRTNVLVVAVVADFV